MTVTRRVSEELEDRVETAQRDDETFAEALDRLFGIDGQSWGEKMREIAQEEAREVIEEIRQSRH